MPQIINEVGLGAGLGQSLGQGLQQLAALKAQQYQTRQQAAKTSQGLRAIGYSSEEADALAGLDSNVLSQLVKAKAQQPAQQEYARQLQAILGGGEQQIQSQPIQQAQQETQPAAMQAQVQAPQMPGLPNLFPDIYKQEKIAQKTIQPAIEEAQFKAQEEKYGKPKDYSEKQLQQFAKRESEGKAVPVLNEKQATELAKLKLKVDAANESKIANRFKATKEERKQIIGDAKAAKEDLRDLERLEDLEKEGKLDTPGYVEFLKRSGLDIPALMNEGSEEFQKIQANFQRNAKQYYGSRVSNFEIEQFLKTIPSLSQSPEGRKRVIANLKNIARSKLEYNTARKEIMAENHGIPPYDLQEQIDDRVESRIDKLAEKFKADLAKPVPKGQNKFITGLQAAAGSVLGAPGKLLGSGVGKLLSLAV